MSYPEEITKKRPCGRTWSYKDISLVSWRETLHCLLQKVKYVYDDQSQQGVVWNTCIKWKKMPCSFIHIHSNFVLSPDFWCDKKVDCRMFFLSKKMMIQGHRGVQLLVVSHCLATTWGNRHLLFMADGAWVPWTEPMNLMAVQSVWPPGMHVWNIYKTLQLMGSFTYLSTGAGFLSVKSTASHLAIVRFSPDVMPRWSRKVQAVKKEPTFEA